MRNKCDFAQILEEIGGDLTKNGKELETKTFEGEGVIPQIRSYNGKWSNSFPTFGPSVQPRHNARGSIEFLYFEICPQPN